MRTWIAMALLAMALAGCTDAGYETLSVDDWKTAYEDTPDAFLLDVRTPAEFTQGHLENATLLPYTELREREDELPVDKDTPIFVYCRSGNRSGIASAELVDMGYRNVHSMDGGIIAWQQAGYPVVE